MTIAMSVTRGSFWAFGVALLSPVYTFVTSIAIARWLGASGLGSIAFISFARETLTMVLVFGLPGALMRYVGETVGEGRSGRIRALYRSMVLPAGVLSVCGFGALAAVGFVWRDPRWAWVLAGVGCAEAVLHTLPSSFLIGIQRWREAYVSGLVMGAVSVVAKLAVLRANGDATSLFAVDAAAGSLTLLGTVVLAARLAHRLIPEREPAGRLTRNVWRFASVGTLGTLIRFVVFRRTELFFLERFSSVSQLAFYSVPFSLVDTLIILPRTVGTVLAPAVATLHGAGDHERIRLGFERALRIILPPTFFATAAAVTTGPALMRLLYGPAFARAGHVLVILLVTLPFVPVMAVSGSVLLGLGRQWVPTAIIALAAVVNVTLDFGLIPPFASVGAAIANSTAQLVAAVPLTVYAARCVGGVSLGRWRIVRGLVSAVAAGAVSASAVAWLPGITGVLLGLVLFVAVGAPVAVVLRVLSRDDAGWFLAILPDALRRPVAATARVLGVVFPAVRSRP